MGKGSCLCGQVGYEYSGKPATTALCHCVDCQKWAGAAYTSNIVVPRGNFHVVKGSPKSYDAIGASGKVNKHWFCANCGSSLFTELEIMPDVTCIKSGGLDGGEANHPIEVEFYNNHRLEYTKPIVGADQKPEFG